MPLGKLFKTSFQHISRNFGLAFASVIVMTLTFLISSAFGVIFYATNVLLDFADKKIPVVVIIENNTTPDQIKLLQSTIKSIKPNVTTTLFDSNASYDKYIKDNANNPSLTYDVDPSKLPAYMNVNVDSQKEALDLFSTLITKVGTKTDKNIVDLQKDKVKSFSVGKDNYIIKDDFNFVVTVLLSQSTSKFLSELKNTVQVVGIIIAIFLATVSIVIIFVTTGMAIYTNREEIETMELVGATPAYVRMPYIMDGALCGFLGALISTTILFIIGYFLVNNSSDGSIIPFIKRFFSGVEWVDLTLPLQIGLFIGLLLLGAFIGALASSFATKRYLKG